MSDLSTAVRDLILEEYFRGQNLYLAFYSSDPGRAGVSGTDVTTSVRAAGRLLVPSSSWSTVTANGNGRLVQNAAGLDLGNAATSISVTHAGLWTAASGGTFVLRVASAFTTTSGQPYTIGIGRLTFELP